jgi:DNA polymerase
MENIATEIKTCRRCDLWKQRRNAVPGEGNLDALVLFMGEAPGYYEDVKGRPFAGAAGKLLDKLLSDIGLSRKEVFIGNVLKCRPPENRDPLKKEIKTCTPYLDQQIKIIKPKIIVTLGRHSTSYIFSKLGLKNKGITKLHGKIHKIRLLGFQISLIPMYHPAAVLYNIGYKEELESDFQLLRSELEKHRCL